MTTDTHDDAPADRLLHHEYDGIQEYDNPMPFWWKGIFALTIAYAAAYLYWFHGGGPGRTIHEEYVTDVQELEARRAAAPKEEIAIDEVALAEMTKDLAVVERGKAVFAKNCASCHGEDGRGVVGPNLTDRFQIHGTGRLDLHRTITEGVPEKGMLAWGTILPPAEVAAAAVWVIKLRGTDVPGGKAAEGRRVEPFR